MREMNTRQKSASFLEQTMWFKGSQYQLSHTDAAMYAKPKKKKKTCTHYYSQTLLPPALPPCPFIPVWLERSVHVWESGSQNPQTPLFFPLKAQIKVLSKLGIFT